MSEIVFTATELHATAKAGHSLWHDGFCQCTPDSDWATTALYNTEHLVEVMMATRRERGDCRYPGKRWFKTHEDAVAGAEDQNYGKVLHPYRCPSGEHWHLSTSVQGNRTCTICETEQPAWKDSRTGRWVIYAHGNCPTAEVS